MKLKSLPIFVVPKKYSILIFNLKLIKSSKQEMIITLNFDAMLKEIFKGRVTIFTPIFCIYNFENFEEK